MPTNPQQPAKGKPATTPPNGQDAVHKDVDVQAVDVQGVDGQAADVQAGGAATPINFNDNPLFHGGNDNNTN